MELLWLLNGVMGDVVLGAFNPWTEFIIRPTLNTLMLLYVVSGNQMGIAIILLTGIIRLVTLPLTLKQLKQMRAMSDLQPRVREIQERYARDRARISQETMRVYREAGVSPIGCLGPMVVQMPILFGLFRVLVQTLYTGPEKLVGLAEKIYPVAPFTVAFAAAPLDPGFLWLDLAEPDPTNLIVPALVFITTWVQQKMTIMPSPDPRQQSNQIMMLWMMPLMIAFFSLTFPSGLSLYWVVSNVIGVAIQYFITGWGPLFPLFPRPVPQASPAQPSQQTQQTPSQETQEDERTHHERPNRRRGHRAGPERARRRPRRGRGRNTK